MMTGLLAPTSGEVRVCGLDPTSASLELKRRIGVLPEDLGLFDDLTVEEHLLLTGDVYGVPRTETRARTAQLLHALSLEHGRNTFAAACSHGMRKKTAFAMALLPNPQVLFLDEPFEAIDPVTAKNLCLITVHFVRQAGTFVYLIIGLVLLLPLSTDPLRKIPASRLALWPLERSERWLLRAASPWINPLTWAIAALAIWT